jgi:hypothetical protein
MLLPFDIFFPMSLKILKLEKTGQLEVRGATSRAQLNAIGVVSNGVGGEEGQPKTCGALDENCFPSGMVKDRLCDSFCEITSYLWRQLAVESGSGLQHPIACAHSNWN